MLADLPALQKRRELALDADEVEAGNVAGLKLHEHVDVAVRAEIVSQDRAEQRESGDVVSPAKDRDGIAIDGEVGAHNRHNTR